MREGGRERGREGGSEGGREGEEGARVLSHTVIEVLCTICISLEMSLSLHPKV